MKAVKCFILTVVFALTMGLSAHAKEMKYAFVDLSRVFDNYQKTKDSDAVLQKDSQAFQKERDKMVEKVRDAQGKLALLKESEKQKTQADIDKQQADLIEFNKQKMTELAKQRDEKVREILLEIEKNVSAMAKKEGYDMIFNDRVLVYGDQSMNLTEKVLKGLNDSYPGKK
ncbi:MAG: OmpH family outer membrane protein [Candidatus Omnitrophota bacterium]|nr:OmpH family outer membrane protein [Candidatus Omnitrophota bacterium]